jgi:hypothetical protein
MISAETEALWRLMLGCLLFRLGGEQTFTPEEMNEIREIVQGVQIILVDDSKILLRTRGPEVVQRAIDKGLTI